MDNRPLRRMRRLIGRGVIWFLILLVLSFFLFPLYWMLAASFKIPGDVAKSPPGFVPFLPTEAGFEPTLDNYNFVLSATAFGAQQSFLEALLNSILISGMATVVAVLFGTLAAYAYSRFEVAAKDFQLFFILSTRMLPPVVTIIPVFLMFNSLGLRDSFLGLTLQYIIAGLPFVVWMMKGFFDEIPREYEDAAMVDGYSRLEAVWKVVIPEAIPAMLATSVFVLITAWQEFLWVTLLNPNAWSTVPPFLYQIIGYGRTEWARMAAAAMIFISPVVIFTFLVRRHLLRGVTFGAVRR